MKNKWRARERQNEDHVRKSTSNQRKNRENIQRRKFGQRIKESRGSQQKNYNQFVQSRTQTNPGARKARDVARIPSQKYLRKGTKIHEKGWNSFIFVSSSVCIALFHHSFTCVCMLDGATSHRCFFSLVCISFDRRVLRILPLILARI